VRNLTSEVREQKQIEWRRSQVLELTSQGYNQREICQKLQLDKSAVSRDIQFLSKQARENLQYHIHDRIPEEYQNCMTGLKRIIKQTTEIADTAADPKTKLQAFAQLIEGYRYIMELTTGGVIITDAIKYVQGQMNHLNSQEKKILKDIKEKEKGKEGEPTGDSSEDDIKTTNGVF
jgi:DNA-binding MarR family transcriptional regulator